MGGKHNKGCCKKGCVIAEDDFNRNASDLGSGWTHPTGDWITVATGPWINGYAEAQVDGAIAINNTANPIPVESGVCYLDIINEVDASGDKYRAIVNAVDKDSYHFAEFIRNGSDDSILRLGISSGGSDTILESQVITGLTDPSGEPRRLRVVIADNEFCATVSHCVFSFVTIDEALIPNGYKAGFGGDDGTQFSHWTFLYHRDALAGCPACLCYCEEKYIPPILNAHLVGAGRMAGLDCDITLVWSRTAQAWNSTTVTCYCPGEQGWKLMLNCPEGPDGDPTKAKLTVLTGCTDSDTIDTGVDYIDRGIRWGNSSSTCEPLSLVFGPFSVAGDDFVCGCGSWFTTGTYTITITEAP